MLSIIVPVYNESEGLSLTCLRLFDECKKIVDSGCIESCEIIFIDDGSVDGSSKIILEESKRLSSRECELKLFQFSRNFGHSAAVFAGLKESGGAYVAIIDADLQDPPEVLLEMLQKLQKEKADVVYGKRKKREGEGFLKLFTAWFFYRMINVLSGTNIPKDAGDFRVMTKEVRDALVELNESKPFVRGLVAWVGYHQVPYEYDRVERLHGQTKYTWSKMFQFALEAILSFSSFPLKLAIYLGVLGLGLSSFFALHALHVWWLGNALPGWTSLVIGFSFAQSVTLFLIGVMGLYVGRAHEALQTRPQYILRKEIR